MQTLDEQVRRAYEQYSSRPDALAKNTFMASMKEQNEVLYYKVCLSYRSHFQIGEVVPNGISLLYTSQVPHPQRRCWNQLIAHDLQLIQDHLKEMFSVIYTPTEGDAIQNFSRLFRRPVGCFLNVGDVDRVEENLEKWGGEDDIDYIVVSDGGEVLYQSPW